MNIVATTEKFNGNTWSSTGDMTDGKYGLAGCGTQSSALSFGGYGSSWSIVATTEKFNGNTWSGADDMNTTRAYLAGCGVQSSALSFGGYNSSYFATTEKFAKVNIKNFLPSDITIPTITITSSKELEII